MTDPTLQGAPYLDTTLPTEARAADLLGRMTRGEKIAQLGAIWPAQCSDGETFDPARMREVCAQGIGQVTRVSGSTLLGPGGATRLADSIQRWLREETRLVAGWWKPVSSSCW